MSDKELSRVEILRDLTAGRLTVSAASDLMGLERRQVLRLSKAYQKQGATALISKKRGRASNRRLAYPHPSAALGRLKQSDVFCRGGKVFHQCIVPSLTTKFCLRL